MLGRVGTGGKWSKSVAVRVALQNYYSWCMLRTDVVQSTCARVHLDSQRVGATVQITSRKSKKKKGIDDGSRFKFDVFAVAPGHK
jgi:Cft2 family RNA processing exonuclease